MHKWRMAQLEHRAEERGLAAGVRPLRRTVL